MRRAVRFIVSPVSGGRRSIVQFDLVANANPAMTIGRHQYRERGPFRRNEPEQRLHDGKISPPGNRMRMCRKASRHGSGRLEFDIADAQAAAYPTLLPPSFHTFDGDIRAKAILG